MAQAIRVAGVRYDAKEIGFHWSSGAQSMVKGDQYNAVMSFQWDDPTTVIAHQFRKAEEPAMSRTEVLHAMLKLKVFNSNERVKAFIQGELAGIEAKEKADQEKAQKAAQKASAKTETKPTTTKGKSGSKVVEQLKETVQNA